MLFWSYSCSLWASWTFNLQMAIKALSQEPICPSHGIDCEDCPAYDPCENVISRQGVLDLAKKGILVSNGNYKSVCKAINELPSVKPTKTGHWSHDGSHWKNRFICSECGYKLFDKPTNYCPNCGRCMVEPQESEEIDREEIAALLARESEEQG